MANLWLDSGVALYRFGNCTLDLSRHELTRDGGTVNLSPRAFEALEVLLKSYPSAVSRDDLYASVWPDTFVNLTNLNNVIAEIRSAIGDRSKEIVITKHRYGYVLGIPVDRDRIAAGRMSLMIAGRTINLHEGDNLVGRVPEAVVQIDEPSISRRHAVIRVNGDRAEIHDLGSKNGTFIGDQRVETPRQIADRELVRFGTICGTFRSAPPGSTVTDPGARSG